MRERRGGEGERGEVRGIEGVRGRGGKRNGG